LDKEIQPPQADDSAGAAVNDSVQFRLPHRFVSAAAWVLCMAAITAAVFVVMSLSQRFNWFAWDSKSIQRIAVIDVDTVLDSYKRDFVASMSVPKLSDEAREQATESVRRASIAVGVAVRVIADECNCILLVRSAMFNPDKVDDYTDQLAQRTTALLKTTQTPSTELKSEPKK
jgi:uncharacterized membrane protein YcjF (UPF0283 family)